MLILRHFISQDGADLDRAIYVPRQSYPESCDGEFCRLLRENGEQPRFLPFSDEAHAARRAKHGSFAGYTNLDKGAVARSLSEVLRNIPGFPDDETARGLAQDVEQNVVTRAARTLRVPFCEAWDAVWVPRFQAAAVLKEVRRILPPILDLINADDDALAQTLFKATCKSAKPPGTIDTNLDGGVKDFFVRLYATELDLKDGFAGIRLMAQKPGTSGYPKGVVGRYKGRPLAAIIVQEGQGILLLSRYGDEDFFVQRILKRYNLAIAS